ncbi:GntR family transcriptional regulator [Deferrisoma camini]|uniref:GntR family transcriptional regulator n=1 Tax=Deferrisoma camini TaxID=1035120 RepID=UPI00046CB08A|nr:GntR family transcriptional regulator [Deferrisoma camini]
MPTIEFEPIGSGPLYERLARRLAGLVDRGTFRTGERLPSIRGPARDLRVGVNTVREAYALLEDRGIVEARPPSGFYVRPRLPDLLADSGISEGSLRPRPVNVREAMGR